MCLSECICACACLNLCITSRNDAKSNCVPPYATRSSVSLAIEPREHIISDIHKSGWSPRLRWCVHAMCTCIVAMRLYGCVCLCVKTTSYGGIVFEHKLMMLQCAEAWKMCAPLNVSCRDCDSIHTYAREHKALNIGRDTRPRDYNNYNRNCMC